MNLKIRFRLTRRGWRHFVRGIVLVFALSIVVFGIGRGCWWGTLPSGISPLLAFAKWRTSGWEAVVALGAFLGLISLWRKRWFCRWICPLGTCNELVSRAGKKVGLPGQSAWPVGQILGTAIGLTIAAGTPLLLWLDPLAIFGSGWQATTVAGVGGTALFLPLLVAFAFSFFGVGLWCRGLCPLGGLQKVGHGLFKFLGASLQRVVFRSMRFGKQEVPAADVTGAGGPSNPFDYRAEFTAAKIPRRIIVGMAAGSLWSFVPWWSSLAPRRHLRPPGAPPSELRFLSLCVRCGNCLRVCPAGILVPDLSWASWSGLAAPVVLFKQEMCPPSCLQCGKVCPTGAIELKQIPDKFERPIGRAVVEGEICLLADERECGFCRAHCPTQAIRLQFTEETYSVLPVVNPARCTGCGACEIGCPVEPRKAIRVVPCPSP